MVEKSEKANLANQWLKTISILPEKMIPLYIKLGLIQTPQGQPLSIHLGRPIQETNIYHSRIIDQLADDQNIMGSSMLRPSATPTPVFDQFGNIISYNHQMERPKLPPLEMNPATGELLMEDRLLISTFVYQQDFLLIRQGMPPQPQWLILWPGNRLPFDDETLLDKVGKEADVIKNVVEARHMYWLMKTHEDGQSSYNIAFRMANGRFVLHKSAHCKFTHKYDMADTVIPLSNRIRINFLNPHTGGIQYIQRPYVHPSKYQAKISAHLKKTF